MESKENEPQINADERRFVASNPAHLRFVGFSVLPVFISYVFASGMIRRVGFYSFGITIFQKP